MSKSERCEIKSLSRSLTRAACQSFPMLHIAHALFSFTHLLVPLDSLLGHTLTLEVSEELLGDGVEDALETRAPGSLVGHCEQMDRVVWEREEETMRLLSGQCSDKGSDQ